MTKNSNINLSVVNNVDGFTLSGQSFHSGRALSLTSGNVVLQGGAVLKNGSILIGNAAGNSLDQGDIYGGNGIIVTSGAGNLKLDLGGSGNFPSTNTLTVPVTSPAYGTTDAIMCKPAGFLDVMISGVLRKIPFYSAS